VNRLGLAWYLDIGGAMGVVAEPIVVDGVIYVSAPQSRVYAVDAASGKLIWKFDPHVRLNMAINGSYSARTNAGVAVWDGKVYVGTGDCRLIAVDATAGETTVGSDRVRSHADGNHWSAAHRQGQSLDGLQTLR